MKSEESEDDLRVNLTKGREIMIEKESEGFWARDTLISRRGELRSRIVSKGEEMGEKNDPKWVAEKAKGYFDQGFN